ncbi:MAG: TetR/AcrR family transcriptional regulator [Formivibrio sp.]|nr:TetR/AcrR family transcriptional regulator [Formivibrio sp.]
MAMQLARTTKRTKEIGLRERSKMENQDKIVMAARKLFADLGYEATTLRQIAADAGLGLGTLFNYIGDKRDLIYLIFNSEMESLTERALAATRPWQSFSAKILTITEPHYRFFGNDPLLSRILLSEILTHTPGIHLEQYLGIRSRLIRGIQDVVEDAQQCGEIQSTEDPNIIARSVFFAISAALRWWLASPDPEWRAGMRDFEKFLNIQIEGLKISQENSLAQTDSPNNNDRASVGKLKK